MWRRVRIHRTYVVGDVKPYFFYWRAFPLPATLVFAVMPFESIPHLVREMRTRNLLPPLGAPVTRLSNAKTYELAGHPDVAMGLKTHGYNNVRAFLGLPLKGRAGRSPNPALQNAPEAAAHPGGALGAGTVHVRPGRSEAGKSIHAELAHAFATFARGWGESGVVVVPPASDANPNQRSVDVPGVGLRATFTRRGVAVEPTLEIHGVPGCFHVQSNGEVHHVLDGQTKPLDAALQDARVARTLSAPALEALMRAGGFISSRLNHPSDTWAGLTARPSDEYDNPGRHSKPRSPKAPDAATPNRPRPRVFSESEPDPQPAVTADPALDLPRDLANASGNRESRARVLAYYTALVDHALTPHASSPAVAAARTAALLEFERVVRQTSGKPALFAVTVEDVIDAAVKTHVH